MSSAQRNLSKLARLALVVTAVAVALALMAVAIQMGASYGQWRRPSNSFIDVAGLQFDLRSKLDPQFPGRGVTDYPGNTIKDVPKGYAMILKAELLAPKSTTATISNIASAAARFLIEHSDERMDGFPGWGVPVAWDPYSDGSVNPANTKYTISTAIVADALLDWIEADNTAPREKVVALVRQSILPYLDEGVLSPSGLLPYSLEAVDRPYDTFNPAGYLAGLLQRYSALESDPAVRERIRAVADKTVAVHIANKRLTANGSWYWHYSIHEHVPNDLAHAGYIIHGLSQYAEHGGALGSQLDVPAIERHLADFIDPNTKQVVAWPSFRKDANTPARSYDIGMGLFLVCHRGLTALVPAYMASLPNYRTPTGAYLKYPPKPGQVDLAVNEYEAYILLGLSACQRGSKR